MAVIQKSTEQCALLIVFAIVCGFLASLVDSVRQYNQFVCTPRVAFRARVGLVESGA